MSKKPFWQVPQNWIIASLVVGIAGYFAYQEFSKPKVNRLQQASAYFDALEAEERAEAEKQAALKAKQQAEQALAQAAQAKKEAQAAQERANQAQTQKQQMYAQNARNWQLRETQYCNSYSDNSINCDVICVNGNGQERKKSSLFAMFDSAVGWYGSDAPRYYSSYTAYYQAVCAKL